MISKKGFGGSLRLKFKSLCLKIKKNTGTSAAKESFSNILGESEMHLCVPVEIQQVRKVDLNWTCLFCSYGNGMVRLQPARFLVHFSVPSEFWANSIL